MTTPHRSWTLETVGPWVTSADGADAVIKRSEGVGTLQISTFPKRAGMVTANEAWSKVKDQIPSDYTAEYLDGPAEAYCRVWLVESVRDVLFITYSCPRGSEWRELDEVEALLRTLRVKA